jgi:hypothetical protein
MTDDATQGDWQPLADQPIVPEDHSAPRADDVVWAKPPDGAAWGTNLDAVPPAQPPMSKQAATSPAPSPAPSPPPASSATTRSVPSQQQPPAPYGGPPGHPTAGYPAGDYSTPGYPAGQAGATGAAADYLESLPRRRPPLAGMVGLAVIGALILAGLAFAVRGGSRSESATSTGTTASKSALPRPAAGPLDSYLLSPSDVGPGTQMSLVPDGRSLSGAGGVTLDFCDARFDSEKSRVERVQAQYDGPSGTASNEVVRYRPGGAQAAYSEIKKAVSSCGPGYQNSSGTVSHVQQPTGFAGLAPRHIVVSFEQQLSGQGAARSFWVTAVYQFDGDYFSGVYVYSAAPSAGRDLAESLATKAAVHLKEAASGNPGTGGGTLSSPGDGAPGLPA